MVLGSSEKVTILISALEARYRALESIRDRAQGVSIWSLGLLLAAAAWLVATEKAPADDQLIVICLAVAWAWGAMRFAWLANLRTGLRAQAQVAAVLEERLGLYAEGRFGLGTPAVFPAAWRQAGQKSGPGRYFQSTYLILDAGLALFVLAALARSAWGRAWTVHLLRQLTG